jgi:AraC family transcriptional regulator, transcriptional activator of pobA
MSYISNYPVPGLSNNQDVNLRKYNEPGQNISFEIEMLKFPGENQRYQIDTPNQFNHHSLLWIKSGSGVLKADLCHFEIKDNMVLCFSPGQVIRCNSNSSFEGYFISFSADFLFLSESHTNSSFLESLFDSNNLAAIFPDDEIQHDMEDILRKIKKELSKNCVLQSQILKGLLKVFLIYLSRNLHINNQQNMLDRDSEIVRKFIMLVKKNFFTKKMVLDYAKELYVTPNYLNRIVKKISGFTASHHIQQCIIMEAKRQAIYSGLNMKEVADLLGFDDYFHFSKFFKTNSGTNFSCFRNTIQ